MYCGWLWQSVVYTVVYTSEGQGINDGTLVLQIGVLVVLGHLVGGMATQLSFDFVLAWDAAHHSEEGMPAGVGSVLGYLAALRLFLYAQGF